MSYVAEDDARNDCGLTRKNFTLFVAHVALERVLPSCGKLRTENVPSNSSKHCQ